MFIYLSHKLMMPQIKLQRVLQTTLRLLQRCNHLCCFVGMQMFSIFCLLAAVAWLHRTAVLQGFLPIRLPSVENCNVAFDSLFVFAIVETVNLAIRTLCQFSHIPIRKIQYHTASGSSDKDSKFVEWQQS